MCITESQNLALVHSHTHSVHLLITYLSFFWCNLCRKLYCSARGPIKLQKFGITEISVIYVYINIFLFKHCNTIRYSNRHSTQVLHLEYWKSFISNGNVQQSRGSSAKFTLLFSRTAIQLNWQWHWVYYRQRSFCLGSKWTRKHFEALQTAWQWSLRALTISHHRSTLITHQ